jgi:hypothetical protein
MLYSRVEMPVKIDDEGDDWGALVRVAKWLVAVGLALVVPVFLYLLVFFAGDGR